MPRRPLIVVAAMLVATVPSLLHATVEVAPRPEPVPIAAGTAPTPTPTPPPAARFAPLDRPGAALTVPAAELAASLACTPNVARASRDPVLLLSATGADPHAAFDWNYEPALTAAGVPWCVSTAPAANTGDIGLRAEYVVHALREMRARSGRTVAVVGHGQGALAVRYALRFWPDLRASVSDLVGLAPINAGTEAFRASCAAPCPPAYWQQLPSSEFVAAVNSGQRTFAGIDYTVVTTTIDRVATPQPAASALPPGPGRIRNIAVQDVCPRYLADHLGVGTYDPVAWALTLDALTVDGPADPSRVDRTVCTAGFMPWVDPERFLDNSARADDILAVDPPALFPTVPAEPALHCAALANGCPRS